MNENKSQKLLGRHNIFRLLQNMVTPLMMLYYWLTSTLTAVDNSNGRFDLSFQQRRSFNCFFVDNLKLKFTIGYFIFLYNWSKASSSLGPYFYLVNHEHTSCDPSTVVGWACSTIVFHVMWFNNRTWNKRFCVIIILNSQPRLLRLGFFCDEFGGLTKRGI